MQLPSIHEQPVSGGMPAALMPDRSGAPLERLSRWVDRHLVGVMVTPSLVVLLVFVIFPTLFLLGLSLSAWDFTTPLPRLIGLRNFITLFTDDADFWAGLMRSLTFVVCGVSAEFVLGLLIAVLFHSRQLPGISVIRTLLLVPMAMTPVVTGMLWLIMYNPTYGLINYLLSLWGIQGPAWTADPATALGALIVIDIWQWTPFVFLVLSAGLLSIPNELYEAARVDGATGWHMFWYVTLPMLKRVSLLVILLRTVDIWKVFDTIFALTKGGPGTATQTLNFYAYVQSFQWFHLGYAAALMVVAVLIVTVFANVFLRTSRGLLEVD